MPKPSLNVVRQPTSKIRTLFNTALLSVPDSELTKVPYEVADDNFIRDEIIVVNDKGVKSIFKTNSKRYTNDFPTGRKFFVRTESYNSWKALEPVRKAKRLDELMARFQEHLADKSEYRNFAPYHFQELVDGGKINKNDYSEKTEDVDIDLGSWHQIVPMTTYTLKTKGGSRKRRRSTKHRKTKRR